MVKIDLRFGEQLRIGDATVRLERKTGQLACLVIDAPHEIPVKRERVVAPTDRPQEQSRN